MSNYLNLRRYDKNLAFIWHDLLNDEARRTALIALGYIIIASAVMLLMPYAIGLYLDGMAESASGALITGGIIYALLHKGQAFLGWVTQRSREYFFQAAFWYLPTAITALYFARPLRWLSGGTSEIDGGGVESLKNAAWNTLGNYIYGIIPGYTQVLFALIACTVANFWLGFLATVFVIVELTIGRRTNVYMHAEMKPAVDIFKRANVVLTEHWHNVDHIKTTGTETKVLRQIKEMLLPGLAIDDKVWRVFFSLQVAWRQLRYVAAAIPLYGLLAYLVWYELIALPLAVLVFFSFERIGNTLERLHSQQRDIQSDLARVNKYRPVLQTLENQVPFRYDEGEDFVPAPLSVSLQGVTHTVDVVEKKGEKPIQKTILRDVSLDIPAGTKVGIVGPSAAGKSQLLHLLVRGSDPVSGRVLVGGQDLSTLRMETLLRYYGVVMQKSEPFTGTILDNVLYGVSHFDEPHDTDIIGLDHYYSLPRVALERAGLPADTFADGLEERVGYKGLKLSGGQQQRLQIAGAHMKLMLGDANRPRMVIADEPTSSLDSMSEVKVMRYLEQVPEGTTMFMVAHRLSTVANMDQIIFVRPLELCTDGRPQVIVYDSLSHAYEAEALFKEMADAQDYVPKKKLVA
jgi:ABC-type multidrug transport system fused ATPase/permease subunit